MSFLRSVSRASKSAACAVTITFLAVSSAEAQTTTTVINDSFANGFSDLSADDSELDFFTTSSSAALNSDRETPGPIEFASGTSGRAIHGLFAPQTLAAVGDSIDMTFDFTTPASIGTNNEDFRWALFSTSRSTNGQADFAMNIPSSSGTPNPLLEVVAGFEGEIDNINVMGTDLGLRTHNVNALLNSPASTSGTFPDGTPTGTLMNTTAGFDFISGGEDDEITLVPNTSYTGRLLLELTDSTLATIDVTIELLDASGAVISTHTDMLFVDDQFDPVTNESIEIGVNTLSFDFLGISATSSAFGMSTAIGDPDNGITISNVTITAINVGDDVEVLRGDANCDNEVNFADIAPFIAFLSGDDFKPEADVDGNGEINFADIAPFIALLSGS